MAKAATPDALHLSHAEAAGDVKPGDQVNVAADDYGRDPVAGTLLGASAQNIVIRRVDPQVGELNLLPACRVPREAGGGMTGTPR